MARLLFLWVMIFFMSFARDTGGANHAWQDSEKTRSLPVNRTQSMEMKIQAAISFGNSTDKNTAEGVVVYYHEQASNSDHLKRTMSRAIKDCPPNHDFLWSRCARLHSVQQWSLVCRPRGVPHGNGLHWGECGQEEICMEGRSVIQHAREGYYASTAWCVEKDNFRPLAKLLANGNTGASIQTGFHSALGKQYSVAAVLAAQDARTPLNAQSLEITAQTADIMGNTQVWRTLNAGDNQCSNCASVGLLSIPGETQRIKTHVEVKPGTVNGLLFLASVGV